MVIIKTTDEIARLRVGGKILARILAEVAQEARVGVSTASLNSFAHKRIIEAGCTPAFLNYTPDGADRPYPATLITSVNDEVVHGIPDAYVLKDGDIVALDLGLRYDGVFLDHAVTVIAGTPKPKDQKLLAVTEQALYEGISAITPGAAVGDIGYAIERYVKPFKLGIVRDLSGHGVGRYIHEDPYIPNYGKPGKGEKLRPGMVIAIEPMLTLGSEKVLLMKDGYTLKTKDGSRSAHFEHTVLVTENGFEILTK